MLRLKVFLKYRFGYLSLFIVTMISFVLGNYFYSLEHASRPNPELVSLRQDNKNYVAELAKEQYNLTIERETVREMNDAVLRLQSELLEKQLALRFYQKIMAPEFTTNGVNIEKVVIEVGVSARHFRFEVLLAQLEKRKRYIKGTLKLRLIGSESGKPVSLNLMTLTDVKKDLAVNFRYFQHLKNDFLLPHNFIPEKLEVTIKMPRKKGQRVGNMTKQYSWNELLKVPLKPILPLATSEQ